MRVAVDARSLLAGRGVARYTRGMTSALAQLDELRLVVPGRAPVAVPAGVALRRTRLPSRAVFGAAALARRPGLRHLAGGGDVAWLPAPAPVAVERGLPYVLTVHDLSFERRPGDFTAYERAWHRAARPRALARGAARVVTDTAAVAAEVVDRWGVDPGRVRVVAPGVDAPPAGALPDGVPERYVLYAGALEPRKAPEVLAGAHARARAAGLGADLVVAGDGRLAARLRGRPGIHVLGTVADAELGALYAGALAVVLPSWLEGFGLPPLEGLAHGTPAVVSDLPALREVLGDAALYAPPGDAAELAGALLRVEGERDRLVAAGRDRLAALTWRRAARALHDVLAEAA